MYNVVDKTILDPPMCREYDFFPGQTMYIIKVNVGSRVVGAAAAGR